MDTRKCDCVISAFSSCPSDASALSQVASHLDWPLTSAVVLVAELGKFCITKVDVASRGVAPSDRLRLKCSACHCRQPSRCGIAESLQSLPRHLPTIQRPLVVLLRHHGADQTCDGALGWEDGRRHHPPLRLVAKASAIRMKCTRHRCQLAVSAFEAAAMMPSWLSLMTSLTPRIPRRFRLLKNSVQNGSASPVSAFNPSTSRWPSVFTPQPLGHIDRFVEHVLASLPAVRGRRVQHAVGFGNHARASSTSPWLVRLRRL